MVIFEAARAITELHGVTNRELTPAITVLQLFLSSSKPVLRFAAVRTLNKVAFFPFCRIMSWGEFVIIKYYVILVSPFVSNCKQTDQLVYNQSVRRLSIVHRS